MTTNLKLDDVGNLDPDVYDVTLDFGDSFFYHDNWYTKLIFSQLVEYCIITIEAVMPVVGNLLVQDIAGPLFNDFANYYMLDFELKSPFKGQNTHSNFTLDWRNVEDPFIGNGTLAFSFLGELMKRERGPDHKARRIECTMDAERHNYLENDNFSQLVITESAANCILKAIEGTSVGKIHLSKDKLNTLFDQDDFVFTSTSLSRKIKIFKEKLEKDQPLKLDLSYKKVQLNFNGDGQAARFENIVLKYTACMDWRLLSDTKESLIYDEFPMITKINVNLETIGGQ